VRLILHELCGNIVEHGYHGAPGHRIELWWVPALDPASPDAGCGHFVIVDQGEPFSADNWKATDWRDPGVRRRGRGMGIDLVRRASRRLVIHPGTAVGNVTLVAPGAPGEAGPERKENG
jgi:anti-sigma regulatory factor (Ser/Thr protein kinase)